VLEEVAQAYSIHRPENCQLLRPGDNDTYVLTSQDASYLVRIYGTRWRSLSEIGYELELLAHLAARGVSVSSPIAGSDGNLTRPIAAPEGTRHLVVFTYPSGRRFAWDTEERCRKVGQMLAAIHAASDDFGSGHTRFALDLDYLVDRALEAIQPFLAHRPDDWGFLVDLGARLRARITAAAQTGLDWGVCHGDLNTRSLHLDDDGALTAFEFDLCGNGWRTLDLVSVQRSGPYREKGRLWDAFVQGYIDARPLGAADLNTLPLFDLACHLWRLGMDARSAAQWGAAHLRDGSLTDRLKLFRELEAACPG